MAWSKRFGPGLLVTAAFIGPGTITTATAAGAGFGYALLWVLLFSVLATIVLQEMSARLGLVTREGLGEALRTAFARPLSRKLAVGLVVAAVTFGNAAFQTGNVTGAAMGLVVLTGVSMRTWAWGVGLVAGGVLWSGTYRVLERLLVALVGLMSLVFVTTAVMVLPDVGAMFRGMVVPRLPVGSLTMIVALIGTTVVPYNLFLHASAVQEKWSASVSIAKALRESRIDTVVAVMLGGTVTLAVVTTAAAFFDQGTAIYDAAGMARQLEPLLGRLAGIFFAAGLMAAGLTSAITAPLAAAYATAGALGWKPDLKSTRFRAVWLLVVLVGTLLAAAVGRTPVAAIIFAQVANGIILPVIAVFLLFVINRHGLMGRHTNGALANALGIVVVLIAAGLGIYKLAQAVHAVAG